MGKKSIRFRRVTFRGYAKYNPQPMETSASLMYLSAFVKCSYLLGLLNSVIEEITVILQKKLIDPNKMSYVYSFPEDQ